MEVFHQPRFRGLFLNRGREEALASADHMTPRISRCKDNAIISVVFMFTKVIIQWRSFQAMSHSCNFRANKLHIKAAVLELAFYPRLAICV